MNLKHVRLIREILIQNNRGRKINTLQVSYSKPTELNPKFQNVPSRDRAEVQALYQDLGGGRLKNWTVGLTVIVPLEHREM